MKKIHNDCLILNSDYSPLCIIDWQKSMIWYYRSKYINNRYIEIIAFHQNDVVVGAKSDFEIPSIIRILKYLNFANKSVKFSRRNLFIRDNFTCQYCGRQNVELSLDHVFPRYLGGTHTWDNLVTCCKKCNGIKGWRTLDQSGMKLLSKPKIPPTNFRTALKNHRGSDYEEWDFYLQ